MSTSSFDCPSCGSAMPGRFCASCGEKRVGPDDLSLKHFAEHTVEAFTHIDGKVFNTLRTLLFAPGQLTADYLRGRRKPYLAPIPLFLACNLVFFLLLHWVHFDTFTTSLASQMNGQPYSAVATHMVQHKLAVTGEPLQAYAVRFDHAAGLAARSLVVLLIPLLSVVVALH